MVIQRIQSLFLLIAAVMMVLINFVVPICHLTTEDGTMVSLCIADFPALFVLNLITAAILVVAIFLFKTLPLQMKVTRISTVLIVISALFESYVLSCIINGQALWIGSTIMLIVAFICAILALKAMKKDYKLLHDYNRLR